jgi:putative oxidoreductase
MKIPALLAKVPVYANWLQAPLLLAIRLFWGWQFVGTGWGKLTHLDRTAAFFAELHLPLPYVNAAMAGGVECAGGALLLLGLWARLAAVPLVFTMLVAYATSEQEALKVITSDPDKFTSAAPFLFLLASLVVLAFGPGKLSVDALLGREKGSAS